jgi:hypothetical protein
MPVKQETCTLFAVCGPFHRHAKPHDSRFAACIEGGEEVSRASSHLVRGQAVRHPCGHFDTPVHVVELPNGVGVGINAEGAAVIQSPFDASASRDRAATDGR